VGKQGSTVSPPPYTHTHPPHTHTVTHLRESYRSFISWAMQELGTMPGQRKRGLKVMWQHKMGRKGGRGAGEGGKRGKGGTEDRSDRMHYAAVICIFMSISGVYVRVFVHS